MRDDWVNVAMTVEEARIWFDDRINQGVDCPVCGRYAKRHKRHINGEMANSLAVMWNTAGLDWIHVPTLVGTRSREEGKLAYWGLVESERSVIPHGRAGWWRVTEKGRDFLLGKITVPEYSVIFDRRVIGHSGPEVSIGDVYRVPVLVEVLRGA